MRTASSLLLVLALACDSEPAVIQPERDPTLNGTWSGMYGGGTVRFDLRDREGAVTGTFQWVFPGQFAASGQVLGNRTQTSVALNATMVIAMEGFEIPVNMDSKADLSGRLAGNRLAGEMTFDGGDAPAGPHPETGRPTGVRLTPFMSPVTLVR